MALASGRVDWAEWRPTAHRGSKIDPTLLLFHDTAGRLKKYNTANYLRKNSRKVAYHFLIEVDGTLVQLAETDRRVNHAGRSSWKGKEWCNSFSIAVAFVNPGAMKPVRKGGELVGARAYWHKASRGERFNVEQGIELCDTPSHGKGHAWLRYSEEQLETARRLVDEIKQVYPQVDIAGHYHVSPKRKVDPTPLIDLTTLGVDEAAEVNVITAEEAETPDQVLRKQSREYRTTNVAKGGFGGLFVTTAAAFSLEKVTAARTYVDAVKGFWDAYGIVPFLILCFAGYAVCEVIQHYKRQSYERGSYEPSGALDNEGGGDWL
jgi:N-acetyl-anhydromuramyl-L-alanine amidase AmpD